MQSYQLIITIHKKKKIHPQCFAQVFSAFSLISFQKEKGNQIHFGGQLIVQVTWSSCSDIVLADIPKD